MKWRGKQIKLPKFPKITKEKAHAALIVSLITCGEWINEIWCAWIMLSILILQPDHFTPITIGCCFMYALIAMVRAHLFENHTRSKDRHLKSALELMTKLHEEHARKIEEHERKIQELEKEPWQRS